MKNRPLLALVILTAAAVVFLLLNRRLTQPSTPASSPAPVIAPVEHPAPTVTPSAPVTQVVTPVVAPPISPSPLPVTVPPSVVKVEPTVATARITVENVRTCLRQYGSMFNGNPVGTNAEITRALLGENPKKARLLDDFRLNDRGELLDPWATPYFFHQLSGRDTEIRSAGPDKRMWTSDDIVLR
ncbi:MAG: hypothetical protein WCS70_02260 [Verrucomicrobiota bacterium]